MCKIAMRRQLRPDRQRARENFLFDQFREGAIAGASQFLALRQPGAILLLVCSTAHGKVMFSPPAHCKISPMNLRRKRNPPMIILPAPPNYVTIPPREMRFTLHRSKGEQDDRSGTDRDKTARRTSG